MTMTSIGYTPGNLADRIKHSNLETTVRTANARSFTYIELHSGEGHYKTGMLQRSYDGSALRVLAIARQCRSQVKAYLHELRFEANEELQKNMKKRSVMNATVRQDWRDSLAEHVANADSNTLFMIDPCTAIEYCDRDRAQKFMLCDWIGKMLEKSSGLFAYFPVIDAHTDSPILSKIENIIRHSGQNGIVLTHAADQGSSVVEHHNIVVADQRVLDKVINNHFEQGHKNKTKVSATILVPARKSTLYGSL